MADSHTDSGGSAVGVRIAAQIVVYSAFAAFLGYFSVSPTYTQVDPEFGVIKLSFSHAGQPETECRRRTDAQLQELAPNMRQALDCPRRRVSLLLELEIDGNRIYRDFLPPSGLSGDGSSTAYEVFPVPAGRYKLVARLRDSRREQGFDWTLERTVDISPRENLVIDFRAETGGFRIL
jgi:hypothetical protein